MKFKYILLFLALTFTACGSSSEDKASSIATGPSNGSSPSAPTPENPSPAPVPSNPGVTDECTDTRTGFADSAIIEEVCRRTNTERAAIGLGPLRLDVALSGVAQAHAEDMVKRNFFSHTNPDGLDPFARMKNAGISYTWAGENIAYYYKTPADVMTAWMNSAGHKANILDTHYGKIGVGFYQYYWVQDFTN